MEALLGGLAELPQEVAGCLADLRAVLEQSAAGYDVSTVSTGSEALSIFSRADPRPELVLLDMDLPGMNGLEVLEQLRVVDPTVQVLIASGQCDASRRTRALEEGANGYLAKPFDRDTLLATVERIRRRVGNHHETDASERLIGPHEP